MNTADRHSIVAALDTRCRTDARWHSLPAEAKEWLVEQVTVGRMTGAEIIQHVRDQWDAKLSAGTLSVLHNLILTLYRDAEQRRELRDHLLGHLVAANRSADEVEALASGALLGLTRGAAAALGQHTLNLLAQPGIDPEVVGPLLKGFIGAVAETRKHEALELDRDKFEFSAARSALEHLEDLRSIQADASLDSDAKLEAVRRRLFGAAPA